MCFLAFFCVILWLKYLGLYQSSDKCHSWEIIFAAKLFKAHYAINCNTVNEKHNSWQHLDLKFLHKKWRLFGIEINEFSFGMFSCNFQKMHVDNFASFKVLVVKVADHQVWASYLREKFFLLNFSVVAVALYNVFPLFRVFFHNFIHTLCSNFPHDLILIWIEIIVFIWIMTFAFFQLLLFSTCHYLLYWSGQQGRKNYIGLAFNPSSLVTCLAWLLPSLCWWKFSSSTDWQTHLVFRHTQMTFWILLLLINLVLNN